MRYFFLFRAASEVQNCSIELCERLSMKVEHMKNARYIDSSCGGIGGYQNSIGSVFEKLLM